jgi:UDP-2,3-diacylglucosamine pyrophosphatase LpxH
MGNFEQLSKVYKDAKVIPYDSNSKIVMMSDCHRGVGNWGDNFLFNQNLFWAALNYYYDEGFTYIELGDGDELWENRNMKDIIKVHSNTFWLMSKFYNENRLYMIYGNHDKVKKDEEVFSKNYKEYYCETRKQVCDLFPDMKVYEGLVLEDINSKNRIFLIHGNQGDFINDRGWKLGRVLVRYLWRMLELAGIKDPTRAAKSDDKKNKVEENLMKWAEMENKMLIAGHTHRPNFPKVGEPMYFNDGSCVHPRCITAIEIDKGEIALVKWTIMTREDRSLYVAKEILEGPVKIDNFFKGKDV